MPGSRLVLPSQQPVQSTGLPYSGGQLYFYVSDTTTPANTYQDEGLTTPNDNPVILDSSGDAGNVFLNSAVVYKVVLEDLNGNQIWTFDPVYPFALGNVQGLVFAGTTTGQPNAQNLSGLTPPFDGQTIVFTAGYTNTGSATLNTGQRAVDFNQQGADGPILLAGGEIQTGTTYITTYRSVLNSDAGGWQLIGAVSPLSIGVAAALLPFLQSATLQQAYAELDAFIPAPSGRLTLSSGVPVLNAPVLAATSVIYTPFVGNQVPVWNTAAGAWSITTFSELTCVLSDGTLSPAAAVANSLYDMFVWSSSGTMVLSRGPAWTNATTRALTLERINGVLTNATAITNGPGVSVGVYVGTIATDAGAATVSFNPQPAGASGGPSGGAWIGLWNQFNRARLGAFAQDTKASWTYSTDTWRYADNTSNNRITFVVGTPEDSIDATYLVDIYASNNSNNGSVGVGLDSTSVPSVGGSVSGGSGSSGASASVSPTLVATPTSGQHFVQAFEIANAGSAVFNSTNFGMQLSAKLRF